MAGSWTQHVGWLFALEIALAASAAAEIVSLGPRQDNTIYSESQHTNGGGQHLFAGTTQDNNYRRSIISFDVAGNVPAGSTIESATLTLHMSRTNPGAQPVLVHLHRCLAPWGEGTVVGLLGEGGGGPPGPGDATWSFNAYDTSRWTAAGGDYASSSSASALVSNEVAFYTWSSPGLAQDVQSWLDSERANFGWFVVAEGEGHRPITSKRFDSRENAAPEFRPILRIAYTPPGDCGGGSDGGLADAGVDSGIPAPDAAVEENPGDRRRPDRAIAEVGAGCQSAPGPALALLALAVLAASTLPIARGR